MKKCHQAMGSILLAIITGINGKQEQDQECFQEDPIPWCLHNASGNVNIPRTINSFGSDRGERRWYLGGGEREKKLLLRGASQKNEGKLGNRAKF